MFVVVAVALLVVLAGVTVAAGLIAIRRPGAHAGGPTSWGQALAARIGSLRAVVVTALVGWVTTGLVALGLGYLAKSLESSIDRPVFDFVHSRVTHNAFTTLNSKLTQLGYNPFVELVALVSIVVLCFVYRSRWWLPVVAVVLAFAAEKYMQKYLGSIVDRGHPPTTLGTYPSGGVGRMLGIYSMIIALIIVASPRMSRPWRIGLWTGLVTATTIEGYTRVYLSLHWFTDVLFAFVFGGLLCVTNVVALGAVTDPATSSRQTATPTDSPGAGKHSAVTVT